MSDDQLGPGLDPGARPQVDDAANAELGGLLSFTCPRCGDAASERFYGPCTSCRADLRVTVAAEQRSVAAAAYEPKLNVTPNAVALKD